jgi:anti-sigma B factor antagonist
MLTIRLEQTSQGQTICRPVGELDAFSVSQFRQALADLASGGQVIIDLSGIPFMDSAGLGALIGGIRRIRELGGDVAVACNRPTLLRLLHSTGFDRIVTLAPDVTKAADSLRTVEADWPNPPILVDRVDDDPTI